MSTPYFKFKKFTVYHDRCAMKVGTDGVMLGAWVRLSDGEDVLDIGAGSGLVSLMLAQRNGKIKIDSIEIDSEATIQANENYFNSPFRNVAVCRNISLQDYVENSSKRYDHIISNPPFFTGSLLSPDRKRSIARHTGSLPIEEFITLSIRLLKTRGRISFIFPASEKKHIENIAKANKLWIMRITEIYPLPLSGAKRILVDLSTEPAETKYSRIIIEMERHIYSPEFKELLKDFYLKF